MGISTRVSPGAKGTKKLVSKYGERLICVRYRYDEERKRRYKTIELIIDEGPWERKTRQIKPDQVVGISIGFEETELRARIRQAGGIWNRQKRVWELSYERVLSLGIEDRITKKKIVNGKT